MGPDDPDANPWFAVARSEELGVRHIAHTELLGRELALWRDASGAVNAWENRCPHRGVRLTLGSQDGHELRCRYHAWRFASGTGQCTHIPAHPTQKPAAALRVHVYEAADALGFVWARLAAGAASGPPTVWAGIPALRGVPALPAAATGGLTLRSIYVEAAHADVARALHGYRFALDPARDAQLVDAVITAHDSFTITAAAGSNATAAGIAAALGTATAAGTSAAAGHPARVLFFLQPQAAARTVIHGALLDDASRASRADRGAVLRHHNTRLTALRDALERAP